MEAAVLNPSYLCCGRTIRFSPEEQEPNKVYMRRCPHCNIVWAVVRVPVIEDVAHDRRLDGLEWRAA